MNKIKLLIILAILFPFCIIGMQKENALIDRFKKGSPPSLKDIKELVLSGASIKAKDSEGKTPLHLAAEAENLAQDIIEFLVKEAGADLNTQNNSGKTPLHCSLSKYKGGKFTEILVKSEAKTNIKDKDGKTALHLAAANGSVSPKITELLIREGKADPTAQDKNNKTPLHDSTQEHAKVLLTNSANPNSIDNEGNTPLHTTIIGSFFATKLDENIIIIDSYDPIPKIELLLAYNADVSIRNKEHKRFTDLFMPQNTLTKLKKLLAKEEKIKPKNTVEIAIFLDKFQEISSVSAGTMSHPITTEFSNYIQDKKIIISSLHVYLCYSLLNRDYEFGGYTYEKLNKEWSIFSTKNRNLLLFIPKSKYPDINSQKDLSKIGLCPDTFTEYTILSFDDYTEDPIFSEESIYKDFSLDKIFLKEKIFNFRVYLSGHGFVEYKKEIIAQLPFKQYSELIEALNKTGCSFFEVNTCYGGSTIFLMENLDKSKSLTKQNETTTAIKQGFNNFIEVGVGLPENPSIGALYGQIESLQKLDKFFAEEKEKALAILKQKIGSAESTYVENNITEQQILTGKIKLNNEPSPKILDIKPIFERNSEIIKSESFIEMLRLSIPPHINNIPRVRFPGQKESRPVNIFPNYLEESKKLIIKELDKLKKNLSELTKCQETLLKNFAEQKHEIFSIIFKNKAIGEIKNLNIRINNIEEYLTWI